MSDSSSDLDQLRRETELKKQAPKKGSREKASAGKTAMGSADKAAVIIGLAFLALVGFMFAFALQTMTSVDNFLIVWSAIAPIIGVIIGSMPAHFFRNMAETANDRADQMAKAMAGIGSDKQVNTAPARASDE
jgi:hypothetical protein